MIKRVTHATCDIARRRSSDEAVPVPSLVSPPRLVGQLVFHCRLFSDFRGLGGRGLDGARRAPMAHIRSCLWSLRCQSYLPSAVCRLAFRASNKLSRTGRPACARTRLCTTYAAIIRVRVPSWTA